MNLLFLFACASGDGSLTALDELTLSAASGPEEALVEGATPVSSTEPLSDRPDALRTCDAPGDFAALFDRYDDDGDGRLGPPEEDAVDDARADRSDEDRMQVEMAWAVLLPVYDLDGDGALSDGERATLLDDFTARCDALQAKLLADFDTDGDGVLSEDEEAAAREALETQGPPEGAPTEGATDSAGPPPDGSCDGDHASVPPPLQEFDTDGDGALSTDELDAMRPVVRAWIRDGEPVFAPPPPPPAG